MAYSHPSMQRVGSANSDTVVLWLFSTTDAIATVIAAGYFNDASDDLSVNDVILVASSTGGTPALTFTYVNSNTGGVVDVVDGLLIPATDT